MDLNNASDTDFNRKRKPLVGTNEIGLGANQHPETWIPQNNANPSLSGTVKQPLSTTPFASTNPVAMNAPKLSPAPQTAPTTPIAPPIPPAQTFGDKMASSSYTQKPETFIDKMGRGADYVPPAAPSIGQKLVGVGKGLVKGGIQGAALEGATQANNYLLDRDLKNGAFTDNASRVQNFATGARLVGTAVLDNPMLKQAGNQVADTLNKNVIRPVLNGTQAAYDYAFTSPNELKARNQSSAPVQATQPLRNVQVPDLNTPQVAQSLNQMANRPSLVGTKPSVDKMMNTTTLPPATSNNKWQYSRQTTTNRQFLRFAKNSYAKPSMGTPPPNFIFSMKHAVRSNRICFTF